MINPVNPQFWKGIPPTKIYKNPKAAPKAHAALCRFRFRRRSGRHAQQAQRCLIRAGHQDRT